MKVSDLLSDTSKWIKHDYARNVFGDTVDSQDSTAAKWCLSGAIRACNPSNFSEVVRIEKWLAGALYNLGLLKLGGNIEMWNDEEGRKFSDIVMVLKLFDM